MFLFIGLSFFSLQSHASSSESSKDDVIDFVFETLSEIDDGKFNLVELKLSSDAKKTVKINGRETVTNGSKEIAQYLRTSLPENQKTFHQASNFLVRDYKDPNMGTSVQFNSTMTRYKPEGQGSFVEAESGVYVWSIVRVKGERKISNIYFHQKFVR
jgi:hypothetical protein